jgi:hypothetical protein
VFLFTAMMIMTMLCCADEGRERGMGLSDNLPRRSLLGGIFKRQMNLSDEGIFWIFAHLAIQIEWAEGDLANPFHPNGYLFIPRSLQSLVPDFLWHY